MFHLDPGRCRQVTYGKGRSERILDRSQVRQDANLETVLFAPWRWGEALERLVDDAHFWPDVLRNHFGSERLQDNDPRRELQRTLRFHAVFQVPIEVGAVRATTSGARGCSCRKRWIAGKLRRA